jgi:hypothetical protein
MTNLSFIGDNLEVNQTCLGMSCHIGMLATLIYCIILKLIYYICIFSYYNANISHAPLNVGDVTLQQYDYKLDN